MNALKILTRILLLPIILVSLIKSVLVSIGTAMILSSPESSANHLAELLGTLVGSWGVTLIFVWCFMKLGKKPAEAT